MADTNPLWKLAQDLYDQATSDGQITLTRTPPFETIMQVVGDVLGVEQLVMAVQPADIPLQPDKTLEIDNAYTPRQADQTFLNLIGQQTTITFWYAGETLHMSLVIRLRQWNFGISFDQMGGLAVNELIPDNTPPNFGFASIATTVTDPISKNPVQIQQGLNYFGPVNLGPVDALFSILQSKPPQLAINGPLTKVKDPPDQFAFDLRAPLTAQPKPLPLLKVSSPWLGMKATYVFYDDKQNGGATDDEETDEAKYTLLAYPYLGLAVTIGRTDLAVAASVTLDIETYVQTQNNEVMFLVIPSDPTQTSLDNIGNLIGGTSWDNLIPQSFRDNYLKNFALKIFSLSMSLNSFNLSTMALRLGTIKPWPVPYTSFTLDFELDWTLIWQSGTALQTAEFSANLTIAEDFVFFVTVTIPEMVLSGGYTGTLTLDFTQLAEKMRNLIGGSMPVPQGLPTVSFSDLFLTYTTKTGGFTMDVTTDAEIRLFGVELLKVQGLFVSVSRASSAEGVSVTLNGIIGVLGIDFYIFADIPAQGDTIFEIHLINQTLGSLLTYLVHLVDPYFELSLDSPWNALFNISLDALVLRINVTQGIVYLTYNTSINLGFVSISGIGLIYQRARTDPATGVTTPSSVQIALECSFLGIKYGGDNGQPLAWNPMTDPAPAVPGNAALFDLNYLGLGQHVAPQIGDLETMIGIIEAMQKAMVPVDDASTNPAKLPGIAFSLESQWLIATRFTVIGAVELIAIFNDPNLYGLRIQLSGEKVKFFAGLAFEILYKKVTPTIGLYHIELTLPDAMRQLEFGQVSITLPVVAIDIYTNGNFRIDFGFPKGLDFSRSFCVQVFPFIGYGGFYFALLNGATSRKVPQISNGTFNPVIEFGIGLSLGVGKTIDKGVFKAGLSVTVIGIVEGVFAWFNPDSDTVKKDLFYHVQGTVAIVGKLYGAVDFKIIQIDVQVVVYASITLTVEAYAPIFIHLEAGVSVRASVKILFIKISFSFSMTVQADFTIGSASPTPWKVIPSGGGSGQKQLSMQPTAHPMLRGTALFAARPGRSAQPPMDWSPVRVTPLVRGASRLASLRATLDGDEPQAGDLPQLSILVTPAFTQSDEQRLAAFAAGQGSAGNVAVQAVLLPFIQNASPTDAVRPDQIRAVAAGAAEMPFVQLVAHLLAWTIHARLASIASPSPVVTAADLRHIYEQLNADDIDQTGFSYANLVGFIQQNFRLSLQARPADSAEQDLLSATIFPILPALAMTGAKAKIDFGSYNPVDSDYERKINAYLRQLMVDFENSVESDYNRKRQGSDGDEARAVEAATISMATVIFQNYFLMIARIAVQAAIDLLESYPYTIPSGGSPSLAAIAAGFSASETEYTTAGGETLQKIADSYGVLVSTIQRVNPAVANTPPTDPLAAGLRLVILIGALTEIATAQADTLNSLALRYQVPVATIKELNPAVQSLDPDAPIPSGTRLLLPVIVSPESIVIANQDKQSLLLAGAPMPLSGIAYQVRGGETFKSIAGSFAPAVIGFPDDPKPADPAAEFLKRLLAANAGAAVLQTTTVISFDQASSGIVYTSHAGDSISLIATIYLVRSSGPALFNTIDNIAAVIAIILALKPRPADPNATLGANTPLASGQSLSFALPDGTAVAYVTNPLDTATLIAAYFLTLAHDLIDLTDFVLALVALNNLGKIDPDKPIGPGTALKIPTFSYTVNSGDSLNQIGQLFNVAPAYMAGIPDLLAVHAMLAIPAFDYKIDVADTLANVAQRYNLSFDALATSIAAQAGIFATKTSDDKPVVLAVPRVPARHTADLVDDLVNHGDFNETASMVSRFLLHGLRLPVNTAKHAGLKLADIYNAEVSAALATGPLYELIGQQFSFLTAPSEGYEIGLTNAAGAGWLSFTMSSYYAAQGATLDALAARFAYDADKSAFTAALQQLNPGVSFPLGAAAWLVFPKTMALKALAISLTKDEVAQIAGLAGATFDPCVQRLQRLPLYRETPYRYALQKQIAWQTALLPAKTCLVDPQQYVTAPTIWPFPDSLLQELSALPDAAHAYELYTLMLGTQEDSASKLVATDIGCYLWGTLVGFKVQTLPSGDSGPLPNSYALIGADEAGRATLQNVWAYLDGEARQHGADVALYLLYAPDPTSANPNGLLADTLSASATFILRTNLSTLSQSGPSAALLAQAAPPPPPVGQYDAPLSDPADFVKLLWECSVVYSGGYYLNYTTTDGNGLPGRLFAQGSETDLTLLLLVRDPQASAAHPPIAMLHNCAVIGQNIDTGKSSVFVQPITHIVVEGDTLTSVAGELNGIYGLKLDAAALAVANQDVKSLLSIGAKLDVGQPNPYTIAYGDTFTSVAAAFRLQVSQLVTTGGNASAPILEPGALMQIRPGQLHQIATAPPGNTGFQLLRPDPDPSDTSALDMSPGDYLKTLFQLLGYGIAQKYRFVATGEGLPAGPQTGAHDATDGLRTRALQSEEAPNLLWRYQKTLPVYRFAADGLGSDTLSTGANAALPAAVANPYRGIYVNPNSGIADMLVSLNFDFQDIYGNRTLTGAAVAPCLPLAPLDVPVGYFDDLIGLDSWPGLSSAHLIQPGSGGAQVQIALAFKIAQYVAGPDTPYDNALRNAGAHRATYTQILYQVWQPDLLLRLRTSLDQPPTGSAPGDGYTGDTVSPPRTPYPLDRAQKLTLAALAGSVYAFLTAARNLNAYQYVIKGGESPTAVAEEYGTDVLALFQANADLDASDLFGSTARLAIPTFYTIRSGDTINSIAKEISADDLLKYNLDVPLNAGLDIATPRRPPYTLKEQDTLRGIARQTNADVPALAETNQDHPLTKGTSLTIQGVTILADTGDTLRTMIDKFKAQKVATTVGDLAAANQDTSNLFDRAQQPDLNIADYVLQSGDTLNRIKAAFGFDPAAIIGEHHNADLIGFFITGTLLQNGVTSYALQPGDTLNSVAGQHGATLEQLAGLNGAQPLAQGPGGKLYIPFTTTLDSAALPASVYRANGGEKLADIAAKYLDSAKQPLSVAALAGLNRDTPYLFVPGQTISVDASHRVTVGDTDTLATLYARLVAGGYGGSFDAFASAIGGQGGIVQSQALFAAPSLHTGTGLTLAQVAALYGVDAAALVEANRSLSGLFKSTSISFQGATVPIGPNDTFLSIISRFARQNVAVSYQQIVAESAFEGILADTVWMLPPPILGSLSVAITGTPVNPQQIFPVTVELELARKFALIDPDFRNDQSVFLAQTQIAPQTAGDNGNSAQALTAYAQAFEPAFGSLLKVATGQRTGEGGASRQVWAVDFRPGALAYDIQGNDTPDQYGNNPAARYFALKPLANTLVSTTVSVVPYVSGVGLDPSKAEQRTFQAIEMDVWAREFLAAVDLFLAPEYAVPTYSLPNDSDANDHDGAYHYRYVMLYKGELVTWITKGLSAVFDQAGGSIADAQEALAQRLLISLSNAYAIDTVAQLPVTTSSADSDADTAPRLSGKPVVAATSAARAGALEPAATAAYSLSTAKVPMVGGATPLAYLTFLVNSKNKGAESDLTLNLRYAINEIEYDIGAVDNIDGYQSSSWLTLILPIGGLAEARLLRDLQTGKSLEQRARIGQLEIPIPLRAYPTPPSLIDQSGVSRPDDPSLPLPQRIKQLKSWDYSYTFEHQSASQDTTYLKVAFNPSGGAKLGAPPPATYCQSLLAALAQFTAVYPAIKDDLAALPALVPGAANPVALKAVAAFAALVQQVHDGWKACYAPQTMATAQPKPMITYEYRVAIDQGAQTLTLHGIATTDTAYLWPDIEALVWDAEKQAFTAYPLTDKQTYPDHATYRYPFAIPPLPARYRYSFADRTITLYQSGVGSVRVKRNENLGEDQGQTVVGDFIYQTPSITFANAFTPLVIHDEAVNIKQGGETLDQALDNLFSYLLFGDEPPGGSINVKIACRYGYELVGGGTGATPLKTYLPLRLLPRFDFQLTDAWRSAFAAQLAQVLTDWQRDAGPSTENGGFYFDISIYASVEGEVDQPLLELRNLYYPLG